MKIPSEKFKLSVIELNGNQTFGKTNVGINSRQRSDELTMHDEARAAPAHTDLYR